MWLHISQILIVSFEFLSQKQSSYRKGLLTIYGENFYERISNSRKINRILMALF